MPAKSASPSPAPFQTMYDDWRSRLGERHATAVVAGVHEEDVARQRRGIRGSNPLEGIRRRSGAAARARHHVQGPSAGRHHWDLARLDRDGLNVGAAVGIRQRQPDVVCRVRVEEEHAAGEHVRAVVVDAHERQRRAPAGGAGNPEIHGRSRIVIGIAADRPFDADRRDRRITSYRAGRRRIRLRGEDRRTHAAPHDRGDRQRHPCEASSSLAARGDSMADSGHCSHGICGGDAGRLGCNGGATTDEAFAGAWRALAYTIGRARPNL